MLSRRSFSRALVLASLVSLASGPALAAGPVEVAAASNALGAIVAAEGGAAVVVVVDRTLAPTEIRIGAVVHALAPARRGLLDDPRSAPRLGASIRDVLVAAYPALAPQLDANHKTWTHAFVRKILAWNARVAAASVRGKRVADPGDRRALLEWAGAIVDPTGQRPPAALEQAPRDPAAPTLESYVAYIDTLVALLS